MYPRKSPGFAAPASIAFEDSARNAGKALRGHRRQYGGRVIHHDAEAKRVGLEQAAASKARQEGKEAARGHARGPFLAWGEIASSGRAAGGGLQAEPRGRSSGSGRVCSCPEQRGFTDADADRQRRKFPRRAGGRRCVPGSGRRGRRTGVARDPAPPWRRNRGFRRRP